MTVPTNHVEALNLILNNTKLDHTYRDENGFTNLVFCLDLHGVTVTVTARPTSEFGKTHTYSILDVAIS